MNHPIDTLLQAAHAADWDSATTLRVACDFILNEAIHNRSLSRRWANHVQRASDHAAQVAADASGDLKA